jgi:PAS domain S-box-containing protein
MTIDFEKHLREMQRLTQIGSWEWNIASDTLFWSEEHYRIFGLSPEQFTPTFQDAIRFVHPDDVSRIEEVVVRSITNGDPFSCEYRVLRADGIERTVFARGTRTDDAGGASTLYGIVQDITERKQAAADLSPQERRVLDLVAQGRTNKEIAVAMNLSPKTVKNYLSSVFQKLQVTGRAEAVSRILRGNHE